MNKNIVIVAGEPYSVFLELLFKSIKLKKIKKPFLLICSKKLLISQMKNLNYNFKINTINKNNLSDIKLLKNYINVLDIKLNFKKAFDKITSDSWFIPSSSFLAFSADNKESSIILCLSSSIESNGFHANFARTTNNNKKVKTVHINRPGSNFTSGFCSDEPP